MSTTTRAWTPRATRARRRVDARAGQGDVHASASRRVALVTTLVTIANARGTDGARAEYGDAVYMDALQGSGKDYGKREVLYPDFERAASGLQYKDMVLGDGETFEATRGKTATIDWDGYTIGYYGRPFEARNKTKGGAFTGETKDFFRFKASDEDVIGAFREAIVGMKVGGIRRIIVPANNSALGYPEGRNWRKKKPQPNNFSGERALGFVLENQGMIDKTLLFDIELLKIT
ncbi:Peptidyl-prolyl cis-trans isomerase,FKBP-type,domain [Ostreococcus tauri]|uniref:peptidylprolyl isomerase n=1 Tax=Ostreococcus tauri TaxID=70448 RepID=Q01GR8_OSTTA|nr:Peptidyl-prolyl cis-trans isomerase,FKBP-type,domain [Ostreococcus tauri]CAL50076.1 Peptidyl-prolyl cis-trans isomerase,FKBP-type,domain [Ostreococcus tauri]|eukprot:XP_003074224.1 Peptidyl-prolyl cis-trans isomerase,FKBP-type,domain [Ostreococcus tauri]